MDNSTSLANAANEQINSPNTIDFIVKNSEALSDYIKKSPYVYLSPELNGNFFIGYTDKNRMDRVDRELSRSLIGSESTVLGLLGIQDFDLSEITELKQPSNLQGQGVLIGFVDTGIDYTQNVFKYSDKTSKIVSIYDQTVSGDAPYGFNIGTEYSHQMIDEALRSDDPFAIVPSNDEVGHGTFLASVATGCPEGDFCGVAPQAELIVVKLRRAGDYYLKKYLVPPEEENVYESSDIMLGIEYVIKKARELGRAAVICLGVGTNFGGHDGYSLFEQYLTQASRLTGICICVAAGNECMADHHFFGVLPASGNYQEVMLKAGENAGDIYLCMWNNIPDILSVSVKSPKGELIDRIPPRTGTKYQATIVMENATVIIEYDFPVYGSGRQNTVIKILNATRGIWMISVQGDTIVNGKFHIWLPITGFVSPNVAFITPNKNYTVTIPGTCKNLITCGAFNSQDNCLYERSSWGPSRINKISPDLVAPGVNVGGIYPTGYGKVNSTGAATAITAGVAAILMQWGIVLKNDTTMSTAQVRMHLIQRATRLPEVDYPNNQWGYGMLSF